MQKGRESVYGVAGILLAAGLLLAGCAGTARGVKQSVYQPAVDLAISDDSHSQADAMVTVRYPVIVDEDAAAAYYQLFQQNAIGGQVKAEQVPTQEIDGIARALIAKSGYYAMSLYRELREILPPDSVLLSPHAIELDGNGTLVSRPLLASEQIPAVLTIDFNVYSFPDPREMMDSQPLTFGDLVTPLFTVHADRWLRPGTNGLLLSSEPLLGTAWRQSEQAARRRALSLLEDRPERNPRPLDFVTFLDREAQDLPRLPVRKPGASGSDRIAVEVPPLEKIRMDPTMVVQASANPAADPFAASFVKGAAARVVTDLNLIDHDRATFFARQAALSRFDPHLGAALLGRDGSEAMRARLRMGEALVRAERRFLSIQSENLYAGMYEGLYGEQMREMIAAEYRLLEQRRDLARTQNWSTALAIVAMAGAAYVGSNTDSSNYYSSQTLANVLALSSVWAVNTAVGKSAESKTIGENFLVQMAPAIHSQVTVQVEWLESREDISARDFAEFRAQTLALYQRSVRSLRAEYDADCAFRHPALDGAGRWWGGCSEGVADGKGYGVVADKRGYLVEYAGAARGGLAEGTGAMIFNSPADVGAILFEGGFSRGLPDGVVRVERPGKEPRVRRFRAGNDAGSAEVAQLQTVRF